MRSHIIILISIFIILHLFNYTTIINEDCTNKLNINEKDSLFKLVVNKLSQDTISFETCNELYCKYLNNLEIMDSTFDDYNNYYMRQYNTGCAFVRLINMDKLSKFFSKKACSLNTTISWIEYIEIVKKYENYNSDNDIGGELMQKFNFEEYIFKGIIMPESH